MTAASPHPHLAALVDAVELRSERAFRYEGDDVTLHPGDGAFTEEWYHPDPLIAAMTRALYLRGYCGARGSSSECARVEVSLPGSNAHGGWDPGWTILSAAPDGSIFAEKSGRVSRWPPGQYLVDGAPVRPKEGARARAWIAGRNDALQEGFIFFFGRETTADCEALRTIRIYVNAAPESVGNLVGWLCASLDRHGIPFTLKCARYVAAYSRRDTVVLYVAAGHGWIALRLVSDLLHGEGSSLVRDSVPALTLEVMPGVSLGEDPGNGASFGAHRARAIAVGLLRAHQAGKTGRDRYHTLRTTFAEYDICWHEPHRRASRGSIDFHELLSRGIG